MTKTLTFAARDGGHFSVPASSPQVVVDGTPTLLTVVPDSGQQLQYWVVNGVTVLPTPSTPNNLTVPMNVDTHVAAVFSEAPPAAVGGTVTLTHSASEGGSISSPSSPSSQTTNSNVTVTASPNVGYSLAYWVVNGEVKPKSASTPNQIVVRITKDTHVAAVFSATITSLLPYAIFSPDGSNTYTLPEPTRATWEPVIKARNLAGKPIYSPYKKVTWQFGNNVVDFLNDTQFAYFTTNRTARGHLYFRTKDDSNPPQMVTCRGIVNIRPGATRFIDVWLGVNIEFTMVETVIAFE